jgi:hypothetical protein
MIRTGWSKSVSVPPSEFKVTGRLNVQAGSNHPTAPDLSLSGWTLGVGDPEERPLCSGFPGPWEVLRQIAVTNARIHTFPHLPCPFNDESRGERREPYNSLRYHRSLHVDFYNLK